MTKMEQILLSTKTCCKHCRHLFRSQNTIATKTFTPLKAKMLCLCLTTVCQDYEYLVYTKTTNNFRPMTQRGQKDKNAN